VKRFPEDLRFVVNVKSGEPYDVYVGRPSRWGNPWRIGVDGTREEVIAYYENDLRAGLFLDKQLREDVKALAGKRLGCWCAPKPCHAEILVQYARELKEGVF